MEAVLKTTVLNFPSFSPPFSRRGNRAQEVVMGAGHTALRAGTRAKPLDSLLGVKGKEADISFETNEQVRFSLI